MYTTIQVRSEFGKFPYTAICMRNECVLWSDNTCVFTRFHSVKNANTQLIWSSVSTLKFLTFYEHLNFKHYPAQNPTSISRGEQGATVNDWQTEEVGKLKVNTKIIRVFDEWKSALLITKIRAFDILIHTFNKLPLGLRVYKQKLIIRYSVPKTQSQNHCMSCNKLLSRMYQHLKLLRASQ